MKKRWICLGLVFAMMSTQVLSVAAAKKEEIKAQKSAVQSQLSSAEAKVSALENQKQALMGEIDTLDQKVVQLMTNIDLLDGQISGKENAIIETQADLVQAEADRDAQYEAMKKRIQYLYENGGSTAWAQILLETQTLTDLLSKAEYTEKLYQFDRDSLQKLKDAVQQVTDLENQLVQEKAEMEDMQKEQERQKEDLEGELSAKKSSASDYEAQIANAESQASQYRSLIEQQNAELQKIVQSEQKAAAAQTKTAAESAGNSQSADVSDKDSASDNQNNQNNQNNSNTGNGGPVNNSGGSADSKEENSTPSKDDSESNDTSGGGGYSATGEAIVAYASQFIGNPYVYGGNSLTNGIDCSGFVQQVFGHFGYSLPRTSDAQATRGRGISFSESRAGDIIVYPGHVAILTGDGGIVHASNSAPYPQGGIKYTSNALYTSYIAVRRIVD